MSEDFAIPRMLQNRNTTSDFEKNIETISRLLSHTVAIQNSHAAEIKQQRYEIDELLNGLSSFYNSFVQVLNRYEQSRENDQRLATSLWQGEVQRSHNLIHQDRIANLANDSLVNLLSILKELNAKNATQRFADESIANTLAEIAEETKIYEQEQEQERLLKKKLYEEELESKAKRGGK